MEKEIINGEVVTTTKEDLQVYISNKQDQLNTVNEEINRLKLVGEYILAELSSLIK